MNNSLLSVLVCTFFFNFPLLTGQVDCPGDVDHAALLAFYNSTNGTSWTDDTGWGQNCDLSTWFGVTINGAGRVIEIDLRNNNLSGNLPSELGDLTSLRRLYLHDNAINGSIPTAITGLNKIVTVQLQNNQLSGALPVEIGSLIKAKRLNLQDNLLTGVIPSSIGNLQDLEFLLLQNNMLTGSIPIEVGSLSNLKRLLLQENQLSGNIPSSIYSLNLLEDLFLQKNLLSGNLELSIGDLTNLKRLFLQLNQLSGPIPSTITNLTLLEELVLNTNQFSGEIPDGLGNLNSLSKLFLHRNNFEGCIPLDLNNLCGQDVNLSNNECLSHDGDFSLFCSDNFCNLISGCNCTNPEDYNALMTLYNATNGQNWISNSGWGLDCDICTWEGVQCNVNGVLVGLDLGMNNLTGSLPPEIGDLLSLRRIRLDSNNISGVIPTTIGDLSELRVFAANTNQLTGSIPESLMMLSKLKTLSLHKNDLTGSIPSGLSDIDSLRVLNLHENELDGDIPVSLSNRLDLRTLNLHNNNLNGTLDPAFSNLINLQVFRIGNNNLSGPIPFAFSLMDSLRIFQVDNNEFSGVLPESVFEAGSLEILNFSSNSFTDTISDSFTNLLKLRILYLNDNQLTGKIPSTIGALSNLENLHLQDNQLENSIPIELGSLSNLIRLQLQRNDLSGFIPDEISNLSNLEILRLQSNLLEGCIPSSFMGFCAKEVNLSNNSCLSHNGGDFDLFCSGEPCIPSFEAGCPTCDDGIQNQDEIGIDCGGMFCAPCHPCPEDSTTYNVLMAFFDATNGENWTDNTGWGDDCDICNWEGIICTNDIVSGISLRTNNLNGHLPDELTQLLSLESLDLYNNSLIGVIPFSIGNLENLNSLNLGRNEFSGAIPISISNCTSLQNLSLFNNELTGSIPNEIGDLISLTNLNINNNQLEGQIPSAIGMLTNLLSFTAYNNLFTGTLPIELGNLLNITSINLDNNGLTGPLPIEFGNLNSLTELRLSGNNLSGIIPSQIADASNLFRLYLNENLFEGVIPSEIGNLSNLSYLSLADNDLSGCIPASFNNLCSQPYVELFGNECLSHDGGDFQSFCIGDACEASNVNCSLCSDNIQNGTETGVDCGGICDSCPVDLYAETFSYPTSVITAFAGEQVSSVWGYYILDGTPAEDPGIVTENILSKLVLSIDNIYSESDDIELLIIDGGIPTSNYYETPIQFIIPANTEPGDYHIIGKVNYLESITETNYTNNTLFRFATVEPAPTCNDGIQNQDETGVDCGGICSPCPTFDVSFINLNAAYGVVEAAPGFSLTLNYEYLINGLVGVPRIESRFVISSDSTYSGDDIELSVFSNHHTENGQNEFILNGIQIPGELALGDYYIIVNINHIENPVEEDYSNNYGYFQISITEDGGSPCSNGIMDFDEDGVDCGGSNCEECIEGADYATTNLEVGVGVAVPGELVSVNLNVINLGPDDAEEDADLAFYLSPESSYDQEASILLGIESIDSLNSGASQLFDVNVTIPSEAPYGSYFLVVIAELEDYDNENNLSSAPIFIQSTSCLNGLPDEGESGTDCGGVCPPCGEPSVDYAITSMVIEEESQFPGQNITITNTISNVGTVDQIETSDIFYYISTDEIFDEGDVEIGSNEIQGIPAGESDEIVSTIPIPLNVLAQTYHVFAISNLEDHLSVNNLASETILIEIDLCNNGELDEGEVGIDCGGECTPCQEICDNNSDEDNDGLIDCLDPDCFEDVSCPSCTDGIMNQGETGVDCGGPNCTPCILLDIIAQSVIMRIGSNQITSVYAGDDINYFYRYDIVEENINVSTGLIENVYLSTDSLLDTTVDRLLLSSTTFFKDIGSHQLGRASNFPLDVDPGSYYIFILMDAGEVVAEASETNNTAYSQITVLESTCVDGIKNQGESGVDCGGPYCPACPQVDIRANSVVLRDGGSRITSVYGGDAINYFYNYSILEESINGTSGLIENVYLSADTLLDVESDILLNSNSTIFKDLGSHSIGRSATFPNIAIPGDYYLFIQMDSDNVVDEALESNNTAFSLITVLEPTCTDGIMNQGEAGVDCGGVNCAPCAQVDMVALSVKMRDGGTTINSVYGGDDINYFYSYEIKEENLNSVTGLTEKVFLSIDTLLDTNVDRQLYSANTIFKDLGVHSIGRTSSFPTDIIPGEYFLFIIVDADEVVEEELETNNTAFRQITVLPSTDLTLSDLQLPVVSSHPGARLLFSIDVDNVNFMPISEPFGIGVYLSADPSFSEASDTLIYSNSIASIDSFSTVLYSDSLDIPLGLNPAQFYLIFKVDHTEIVDERQYESNNLENIAINILAPNCSDGIQNQDEEDIDCGGVCLPCATCFDGIMNQNENGVDCGGECVACHPCPAQEDVYDNLMAVFDSTGGPGWDDNSGWGVDCDICNWAGVTCTNGVITGLDLRDNSIAGVIPAEIGNITTLDTLSFSSYDINGPLPIELWNLTNLKYLWISTTRNTGSLPPEIGNLVNLEFLRISNVFTLNGALPTELGQLTNLIDLRISNTSISGSIPTSIANLTNLKTLNLYWNRLGGTFPTEIGTMTGLTYINMGTNGITGSLPPSWGNLSNLVTLSLSKNSFPTGSLPPEWSGMTNLVTLILGSNRLSGPLPPEWGALTNLRTLMINNNGGLNGPLPPEWGNLTSLVTFNIERNNIFGPLPSEYETLVNLTEFRGDYNDLTGPLPEEYSSMTNLRKFIFSYNNISGTIPESWSAMIPSSSFFFLDNNDLSGCIPNSFLSNCSSNVRLNANPCLSHNGGDFVSFCAGNPCENSNPGCTTCSDGLLNAEEEFIDCGGICAPCVPKADYETSQVFLDNSSPLPGEVVRISSTVSNIGNASSNKITKTGYFISTNDTLDQSVDINICPFLGSNFFCPSLSNILLGAAPMDTFFDATIPVDLAEGDYFIIVAADFDDELDEYDNQNNIVAIPLTVLNPSCGNGVQDGDETEIDCGGGCAACPKYDLAITSLSMTPTGISTGAEATVDLTIENISSVDALGTRMVEYFVSEDDSFDVTDVQVGIDSFDFVLASQSRILKSYAVIPESIPVGAMNLIVKVNSLGSMDEINPLNNDGMFPFEIMPSSCSDNVMNGDETGKDCGGTCPDACPSCPYPQEEIDALMAFYEALDGDNWKNTLEGDRPWGVGCDVCSWYGFTCYDDGTYRLFLKNNLLNGVLSPAIGQMTNVRVLYLKDKFDSQTQISGPIPPEIGNLDLLRQIVIESTMLSGQIPNELSDIDRLNSLLLRNNQLTGPLPEGFGDKTFAGLRLEDNALEGCIPESYHNLCDKGFISFTNNPELEPTDNFPTFCSNSFPPCEDPIGERGKFTTASINNWVTVTLQNSYVDPVIIAGPADFMNSFDAVVRIDNVTSNSFDIKVEDWDCSSTSPGNALGGFIVLEAGSYALNSGQKLIAQNLNHVGVNIPLAKPASFSQPATFFTQLITEKEADAVISQSIQSLDQGVDYEIRMVESKSADGTHGLENVSLLAVEEGEYSGNDLFEFYKSVSDLSSNSSTLAFSQNYQEPIFIAKSLTANEDEPYVLRYDNISSTSVDLFIDEDDGCDSVNSDHTDESFNYMTFDGPGLIYGDELLPDLIVLNESVSASNISSGSRLIVSSTIDNLGEVEIFSPFYFELFLEKVDGSEALPLKSQYFPNFPTNTPFDISLEEIIPFDLSGSFNLVGIVDSKMNIAESNETNNKFIISNIVITPDPCYGNCGEACPNACPNDLNWPPVCQSMVSLDDYQRDLDPMNYDVGVIAGSAGVSANGDAIYNIPIQVSPGTMNMVPDISLTYSSSAKNGIAGYGWNVLGESKITRTGKNQYFEGEVDPVNIDQTDNYLLDGTRLILTSGTSVNKEFSTEVENFSKVVPEGALGDDALGWKIFTKEGGTMEYGNLDPSLGNPEFLEEGTAVFWPITKVSDRFGNYMTYHYELEGDQFRCTEIRYTGNDAAGVDPYNRVIFRYKDRGDINESYIHTRRLSKHKLLYQIEVRTKQNHTDLNDQLVRRYDLCHSHGPITDDHGYLRTYLQEVTLTGANDSTQFHPTRFVYGNKESSDPTVIAQFNEPMQGVFTYKDILRKEKEDYIRTGDLNGDGLDDIVLFRADEKDGLERAHEVEVYVKQDANSDYFEYLGSESLEEYLDVAFKKPSGWFIAVLVLSAIVSIVATIISFGGFAAIASSYWYLTAFSTLVTLGTIGKEGGLLTKWLSNDVSGGNFTFAILDFNGDNREEAFLYTPDFKGNYETETFFTVGLDENNDIVITGDREMGTYTFDKPFRDKDYRVREFQLGDFDGDSKGDVMAFFMLKDSEDQAVVRMKIGLSSNDHVFEDLLPGDVSYSSFTSGHIGIGSFDGDSKSDIIINSPELNGSIPLTVSHNGASYELKRVVDAQGILPYPNAEYFHISGDFNGDGKTDLLTSVGNGTWEAAYFNGADFTRHGFEFDGTHQPRLTVTEKGDLELQKNQQLFITDFNNDGLSDIMFIAQKLSCQNGSFFNCGFFGPGEIQIYYSTGLSFVKEQFPADFGKRSDIGYAIVPGDFDGDGIEDLLITGDNSDKIKLKYINKDSEDLLMKKVLDGHNNESTFVYKKMTDSDIYQQTNEQLYTGLDTEGNWIREDVDFPITKLTSRTRLVHQLKMPNGLSTGENVMEYQYEDAIYHRHGKGMLGFMRTVKTDQNQNRKVISSLGLNTQFYTAFPRENVLRVLSTDEFLSQTTQTVSFQNQGDQRFWLRLDGSKTLDVIANKRTENSVSFDPHGNVLTQDYIITGQQGIEIERYSTTFSEYVSIANELNPIPYLPLQVVKASTRTHFDPAPTYDVTTRMSYTDRGLISEQRKFYGSLKEVKTSFSDYNEFGNPKVVIISAIDVAPRTNTVVYDDEGRFIIQSKNALDQSTYSEYDARWGVLTYSEAENGNITRTSYDPFGRSEKLTTPSEYDVTVDYRWDIREGAGTIDDDAADAVYYEEYLHPAAPDNRTWYNSVGRPRKTTSQNFKQGDNEFNDTHVVQTYDLRGRSKKVTNSFFTNDTPLVSEYEYDEYNRPQLISSPTGTMSMSYENIFFAGDIKTNIVLEDGKTQNRIIDPTGKVIENTDTGGNRTRYKYFSHGKLKEIIGNGITSTTYDEYARQKSLTEPNIGTTNYDYNSLGQLTYQLDSRPNITATNIAYDVLGRVDFIDQHEGHIEYNYHPSGNGINQISSIVNYNGFSESFTYDALDRLQTHTETINGESFTQQYSYTLFDQLESIIYPSNLAISYDYYEGTGFLESIKNHLGDNIYQPLETNSYGRLTKVQMGNGLTTQIDYDEFGILTNTKTVENNIFNMSYDFEETNGVLNQREDEVFGLIESFTYDDDYRLISASTNGVNSLTMAYEDNGNIETKSDISNDLYEYHPSKIHAVTSIPKPGDIKVDFQSITYNSSQQPTEIENDLYTLNLQYGSDEQRRYSILTKNDGSGYGYERYYCQNFERHNPIEGEVEEIHYIDGGIIAIGDGSGVNFEYYYTYTDYLGSVVAVTDNTGAIEERRSYDAWGRPRNPEDWSTQNSLPQGPSWLYRGYTGHEMLSEFDLINMNGRLYDPKIARMLSVDNYAGLNGSSQSYNRYSYVYNNPFMYTDPTGENPLIRIGIGAVTGALSGGFASDWDWKGILGGAVLGGVAANYAPNAASGIGINVGTFNYLGPGSISLQQALAVGSTIANAVNSLSTDFNPLYKDYLLEYVRLYECPECSDGQLQNYTGQFFEDLFNDCIAENRDAFQGFHVPGPNGEKFAGDLRHTIPDYLGFSVTYTWYGLPKNARLNAFYELESFIELKATKNNIGLSSFSGQLKVQIRALKALGIKKPHLIVVTTYGVKLTDPLINFAKKNNVEIFHHRAKHKLVPGGMKVDFERVNYDND